MKKLVILLFAVMILAGSCAKDIIVTSESDLRGPYKGTYMVTENYETGLGEKTYRQYIDWRFSDYNFYCNVNDTINDDIWLCDCSGEYSIENYLVLSDTTIEPQTCVRDRVPIGDFMLIRYNNEEEGLDSLTMTYVDRDLAMRKFITLYPLVE